MLGTQAYFVGESGARVCLGCLEPMALGLVGVSQEVTIVASKLRWPLVLVLRKNLFRFCWDFCEAFRLSPQKWCFCSLYVIQNRGLSVRKLSGCTVYYFPLRSSAT